MSAADALKERRSPNRRAHAGTMETAEALIMGILMSYGGSETDHCFK